VDEERIAHVVQKSASGLVCHITTLSEIADTATRYIKALDSGDAVAAKAELAKLREWCEGRAAGGQDRERG
jgi:hypothetical protein